MSLLPRPICVDGLCAHTSHILLTTFGSVEVEWKMYASSTELSLFK